MTITNPSRGQIFSPPVIAIHSQSQHHLFTLGEPAEFDWRNPVAKIEVRRVRG